MNAKDKHENIIVMEAIKTIKLFVKKGIGIHTKNKSEITALDVVLIDLEN